MSSAASKNSPARSAPKGARRAELLSRLWDLGRISSTQTVFLHQAIAQGFGLNATDTKCLDLILRGESQGVTAGHIAEQTGLTTGAITHIIDRLEKRHFVERIRDARDRRKVYVRGLLKNLEPMIPKYEAVGKAYMTLMNQYSDKELELICDYMEKATEISQRELRRVIAENQNQSK